MDKLYAITVTIQELEIICDTLSGYELYSDTSNVYSRFRGILQKLKKLDPADECLERVFLCSGCGITIVKHAGQICNDCCYPS